VPDEGCATGETTRFLARVADEQAALRRVAMLVARGAAPEAVFASVAEEVAALFDADIATVIEFSPDGEVTRRAAHGLNSGTGTHFKLGPRFAAVSPVWQAGGAIRLDEDDLTSLDVPEVVRAEGARSSVNAAVLVEGRIWGVIGVGSRRGPLPPSTEERLVSFTELTAIAVASAQARSELRGFATEQAALRRVATLVARGAPPHEVFMAVAEEAGRLLRADFVVMSRYDPDATIICIGAWSATDPGRPLPIGLRVKREGRNMQGLVFDSGQPARLDDYDTATGETAGVAHDWGFRAAVGVPMRVDGRLWGVVSVISQSKPLPVGAEERLAGFTELAATAIADAQARTELREFAEEQAALRRVATLVARATEPEEVFAAVTEETGRLLDADVTGMSRYDPDGTVTLLSAWARPGATAHVPAGSRFGPGGHNTSTMVFQTGKPARIDDLGEATGPIAEPARKLLNARAVVSVPVEVEGRLWGIMGVTSKRGPLPAGTEARLAGFTELAATAIANAEARAALTASRARIVAAADAARRRIERDLHDAAQERLVPLVLQLRAAQAAAPGGSELVQRLENVITEANDVLEQLREIARGLHPSVLADGGLRSALTALARRSAIPVRLDLRVAGRFPERAELTAYYAVSEALANTAKHAHASGAEVEVTAEQGMLRVRVSDDGLGGADFSRGSGLAGLRDRVEAVGGRISLRSQPGAGTAVEIGLPLRAPAFLEGEAMPVSAEQRPPAPGGQGHWTLWVFRRGVPATTGPPTSRRHCAGSRSWLREPQPPARYSPRLPRKWVGSLASATRC
jgi:signal transduction histidine kinase